MNNTGVNGLMQKVRDVCRNDWNWFSKMLLKNFLENYSDLFKEITLYEYRHPSLEIPI